MGIRKLTFSEKLADWVECPDCDGQVCQYCENSGNPGYIWFPESGDS